VLAAADLDIVEVASASEILTVLVKRKGKQATRPGERLFDPVTVVDVNVHHAIALLEKRKDTKAPARDGAETGGLALFT
jgi:hypothetical protein